jgi:uncharacterized Tic20 family protein
VKRKLKGNIDISSEVLGSVAEAIKVVLDKIVVVEAEKKKIEKEIVEKQLDENRVNRNLAIIIIIIVCLLVFICGITRLITGEALTGLLGLIVGGVFGFYFPKKN